MRKEAELLARIARSLRKNGFSFRADQSFDGLRPDFVINAPDGRLVVLELKDWEPTAANKRRALVQARLYSSETSADDAFFLLPALGRSYPQKRLLAVKDFAEVLRKTLSGKSPVKQDIPRREAKPAARPMVFAAMPFKREYDDVYFVAMRHAAESAGADCVRVDYDDFAGDIPSEIKKLITQSIGVIADVSESRPNVLFEIGYAQALGRPVVQICSTPADGIPLDIRNEATVLYHKGQTHTLRRSLAKRLTGVLRSRK